jgi:hypothetical protein
VCGFDEDKEDRALLFPLGFEKKKLMIWARTQKFLTSPITFDLVRSKVERECRYKEYILILDTDLQSPYTL